MHKHKHSKKAWGEKYSPEFDAASTARNFWHGGWKKGGEYCHLNGAHLVVGVCSCGAELISCPTRYRAWVPPGVASEEYEEDYHLFQGSN